MGRGYPDWSGPKVGVYLQPEWAAKEGTDKNFVTVAVDKGYQGYTSFDYAVPTGKTLYITSLTFYSGASDVANADLNQIAIVLMRNLTQATYPLYIGGNGGGQVVLSKPIVFAAGDTIRTYLYCYANHNCDIGLTVQGYEV